eukprot:1951892-Prymnesium_polylepis.1
MPADLVCYVLRYPDLLEGYCQGSLATCYWQGVNWHAVNRAPQVNRIVGCSPPSAPPSPPSSPVGVCSDDCQYSGDGDCDDGGLGSEFDGCEEGADCTDC